MKASDLIISLVVMTALVALACFRLMIDPESSIRTEKMPVDSRDFLWVRMDSLSHGLSDITGTDIHIDSTGSRTYVISYNSKQFLLHERVEGIETNRKHLLENAKDLMEYEEDDSKVVIKLKRKDGYVYCPVLILDRILYWKNKK